MNKLEYKNKGISYKFFDKNGGVSSGVYSTLNLGLGSNDERENLIKNREIVKNKMEVEHLLTLSQCHGNDVVNVTTPWDLDNIPTADAMVTKIPNIGIGILTADCAPVLFYDDVNKVIGACHSGWRGTKKNIVNNTINAMLELGACIENIVCVLGPCLSQKNFEVGDDFFHEFIESDNNNDKYFKIINKRHHFDMKHFIKDSILNAGIKNFNELGIDTYDNKDKYFSYRRNIHEKIEDYGRQISVICIY